MGAFVRTDDYSAQLERVYELFPPLRQRRRPGPRPRGGGPRGAAGAHASPQISSAARTTSSSLRR
jgi:hypothetical protein